jgi:hypothetical protein
MLGISVDTSLDLQLGNPRVASPSVAGQPFDPVLQHLCALIELNQSDSRVLT